MLREVSHSHLASLWRNPAFARPKPRWLSDVHARFGAAFTVFAIALAAGGAVAWWPDAAASADVATAVLIIACPCALTLAAPVTGLLTLRGAWDRVREDPVLKFMVVGVTAYGMATFEGPMMSFKNVNARSSCP